MNPEFNLDTFLQERQDVQLPPEKKAEVDDLIKEFQALPDKPESLERLKQIIERLNELYGPETAEISPEVIKQNQEMYDWLGIEVNLQKELEAGNIVLPSKEQQELAKKHGYAMAVIIPGNLSTREVIESVNLKLS